MPGIRLAIKPGVDTQGTPLQTGAGIQQSQLIRHKNGLIQKLGGCQRLVSQTFGGIARALLAWADSALTSFLGIGTTQELAVLTGGIIYNITPVDATSDLTAPFTTTSGDSIVTISDAGYTPTVGQFINIQNAMYVGGLVLQGVYEVLTVTAPDYTIDAGSNATSSVAGGGTAVAFTTSLGSPDVETTLGAYVFGPYENLFVGVSTAVGGLTLEGLYTVTVAAGPVYTITADANAGAAASASENGGDARINYLLVLPAENTPAGAFGAGPFGAGPFGVGTGSGTPSVLQWSLARWGQDSLVANYTDGKLYEWSPPVAPGNFATEVSGAPPNAHGIFVAAPQQQMFAFGAYSATLSAQDPLLAAWCDVANLNDWTATTTNQAGSFRLSSGSEIMGGCWFGVAGLLWTDVDLWSVTYIGFPLVYGFNQVAPNCGLIAQRAFGVLGSTVAWLSQNDFFQYRGGAVSLLPCTVRDVIFSTLDRNYAGAIHADPNTYFGEITWHFPQYGSEGACTGHVKVNLAEGLWDYWTDAPNLSAWTDQSPFGAPIGADYAGLLQQFETSTDFDGQILASSFLTGFFEIGEGGQRMFIERIIPDFTLSSGGAVQITVTVADQLPTGNTSYPVRTYGPFLVTEETPYIIVRAAGRFAQILVESIAPNTFWRYGAPLAIVQLDGG